LLIPPMTSSLNEKKKLKKKRKIFAGGMCEKPVVRGEKNAK